MIYKLEARKDRIKDPRDLSDEALLNDAIVAVKSDNIWILRYYQIESSFEEMESGEQLAIYSVTLGLTPHNAAINSIQQMINFGFDVYVLENPEDALHFMMEGSHA